MSLYKAQEDDIATAPETPDLRHRYISLQTRLRRNRQLIRQRQEETSIFGAPRSSSCRDLPPLVLPPLLVPLSAPAAPAATVASIAPVASVAPVAVPAPVAVSATTIPPPLIGQSLPAPPPNVVLAPIAVAVPAANVVVPTQPAVVPGVAVGPPPPLPGQTPIPAMVWNDPTVRRFVLAPQGYQEYLDLARLRAAKPYYRASPGCCRLMRVVSAQIPSVGPIHGPNNPSPPANAEASRNLGNLGNGPAYDVLARYRYDRLSAADRAFLDAFYP